MPHAPSSTNSELQQLGLLGTTADTLTEALLRLLKLELSTWVVACLLACLPAVVSGGHTALWTACNALFFRLGSVTALG